MDSQKGRHALLTFCIEMIGLMVDEGRAVNIVCSDCSKAFSILSCNIFKEKVLKCGLDEQTGRWAENWLNGRTQTMVISGITV